MPAPYSAGSIFLQVIPSFRGSEELIRKEAKEWGRKAGEEFDKNFEQEVTKGVPAAVKKAAKASEKVAADGGEEAGEEYSGHFITAVKKAMATASKEIGALELDVDDSEVQQTFAEIKALAETLEEALEMDAELDAADVFETITEIALGLERVQDAAENIDARVNAASAFATVEALRAHLMSLNAISIEPDLKFDRQLGSFESGLRNAIRDALGSVPPQSVGADATPAQRAIAQLRQDLFALSDKRIGLDITGEDAYSELVRIQAALRQIASETYEVDLQTNVDVAAASAKLAAWIEGIEATSDIDIDIDINDKELIAEAAATAAAIRALHEEAGRASDRGLDGANSFRAFNARVLGISAVGPIAIPILGTLAAGLGAVSGLALAGASALGILGVAGSGIGDVVSALGKLEDLKEIGASEERIKTATENLEIALNNVGPAAENFARYLFSLGPGFRELREGIQESLLPRLQNWMETIGREYGPQFVRTVEGMTDAIGRMFDTWATSLEGPAFHALADMMERSGPAFIDIMGRVLANLGEGVASLVVAMEPLGFLFGGWLESATASFADWAAGLAQTQGFADFLEWVERIGPKVGEFFIALGAAIVNIGVALAPYAETLLEMFTGFLTWIAGMDPSTLGAIAVGLVAITVAFQTIVGLNSLVVGFTTVVNIARAAMVAFGISAPVAGAGIAAGGTAAAGGLAAMAGGVAIAVGALVLIGTALYLAYQNLDWFRAAVDFVWDAIQVAFQAVVDWLQTYFVPIWEEVWGFMGRLVQDIWEEVLEPIFSLLGDILSDIWSGLAWAWENIGYPIFVLIGQVVETLWDIIGPIFGFIADVFRTVWDVLALAWNRVGKPIFDGIIAVITFLWENVIEPVFGFIGEVFATFIEALQWVWEQVDKFLGWIGDRFNDLKDVVGEAMEGAGDAAQNFVETLARTWLGEKGGQQLIDQIKTSYSAIATDMESDNSVIKTAFGVLFDDLEGIWNEHGSPFLKNVGRGVDETATAWVEANKIKSTAESNFWRDLQSGWDSTGGQVLELYRDFRDKVLALMSYLWEQLKLGFDGLWDYIWESFFGDGGGEDTMFAVGKTVTDTSDKAVRDFDALGSAFDAVMNGLKTAWDVTGAPLVRAITDAFDGMKRTVSKLIGEMVQYFINMLDTMKTPVRFIINDVINRTFIHGFNQLADAVGSDARIPFILLPKGFSGGGFTGQGGKYEPKGVVHGGEYVEPMESVDYYGQGIFEALHKRRIPRQLTDALAGYADGGYVAMSNAVKAQFPWARITSGYRPGDPGYHGKGQAIDIAGSFPYPNPTGRAQILQINQWIARTFSNITELIHTAAGAVNLWRGQPHRYSAKTALEHMNHVHWAMAGILKGGARTLAGAGLDLGMLTDPVGYLRGLITDKLGDFSSKSTINAIIGKLPLKLLEVASDKIGDLISNIFGGAADPFFASKTAPENVSGNAALVRQMAASRGWVGGEWDALYSLIMKESGFRNTAQNPTSTAYGMFQFLNSTWAGTGIAKTSDPRLQTEAGFRYIASRYGTPSKALAFHLRNNWYEEGGYVPGEPEAIVPELHDTGGWLMPGLNVVMNRTGRPEPTINPQTLDALQTIADRGAAGAPLIGQYIQEVISSSPQDALDEVVHRLDVLDLGGRYPTP